MTRQHYTKGEETAAGSDAIVPEGVLEWHEDTDELFVSDGTTKLQVYPNGAGPSYGDEDAQDAVGNIVADTSTINFNYADATPEITAEVINDSITFAKIQEIATDRLLGREASGSGNVEEIALGINLQLSSATLNVIGSGVRLPCWDNPPASPHTYDDEFDSGTLDGKWTVTSTSTTNAITSGTIDYRASLTTPIYDVASTPSWLMYQSDNSSLGTILFTQTITLDTNATIFIKFGGAVHAPPVTHGGNTSCMLWNSSDSNEHIDFGTQHTAGAGAYQSYSQVQNNGAFTTLLHHTSTSDNQYPSPAPYMVLWKVGNVYRFGIGQVTGVISPYRTTHTKTGVTTFDRLSIRFLTSALTPSVVEGVDYIRYYPQTQHVFQNP